MIEISLLLSGERAMGEVMDILRSKHTQEKVLEDEFI
jgi:hypothetical protein